MFTCRKLWDNLCLFIESLHKLNPLVVSSLRSFKKTLTVNVCTPCGNTSICSTNVISIQQYVHSTWTHLWMEPTLYMQMSLNIRSNHLDSFVNGTNLIYICKCHWTLDLIMNIWELYIEGHYCLWPPLLPIKIF